ncbi:MAG: polysaccharide deacetylase family protein [Phycisphaerae bacterium]|nr:polysaccharide deacetylase family protein [Phycisphaerae bacterium]
MNAHDANTIILSFDMEPDLGSWTSGQRGIREGTPEILNVLRRQGVPATFLFTGREAEHNPDIVARVLSDGHEIGCHTMFHETLGNAVFQMPGDSPVLDAEIPGRLALATDTVERIAGVRPVSFRAPRLFGSTTMVNALEDLGYRIDSSYPAYFHGSDFRPYHPDADDWARPGNMRIVELPLFYDTDAVTDDPLRRSGDQWPQLRLHGPNAFADLCRRMFPRARNAQGWSVLCVYLHPWEFVTIPEELTTDEATIRFKPFLHKNTGRPALEGLDAFIEIMKREGAAFAMMKDLRLD